VAKVTKKPAARKLAGKNTAAKKTPMKKTAVKKLAAKNVPAKKMVAKRIVAKKMTTKAPVKAAVKNTAVKKAVAKKIVAMKPATLKPVGPYGIPEQLRDAALKILDERQAEDIVTISLAGRSPVADYMIIASGRAGRQVSAIADYLREAFFKLGIKQVRIEGLGEANWVLIDGGDVIVHLFRPEVRSYYDLDAIWSSTKAIQR
jgi:ribosome-associated protein